MISAGGRLMSRVSGTIRTIPEPEVYKYTQPRHQDSAWWAFNVVEMGRWEPRKRLLWCREEKGRSWRLSSHRLSALIAEHVPCQQWPLNELANKHQWAGFWRGRDAVINEGIKTNAVREQRSIWYMKPASQYHRRRLAILGFFFPDHFFSNFQWSRAIA